MTVEDPSRIDAVGRGPQGRLLLSMTEARFAADVDQDVMVQQILTKLNAYVGLIRSGQLAQIVGVDVGAGVDIELTTMDEPPANVRELVDVFAHRLQADRVGVTLRVLPPQPPERIYDLLAADLEAVAPAGWQRLDVSATLVGTGLVGSLTATVVDGTSVPLPPADSLVDALRHLKRSMNGVYGPAHGTFVTFAARLVPGTLSPSFDFGEPEGGAGQIPAHQWEEELRRYPREPVPAWWPRQPSPRSEPQATAATPEPPRRRRWFGG